MTLAGMAPSTAEMYKVHPEQTAIQKLFWAWCEKDPANRMTATQHPRPSICVENVWRFIGGDEGFVEAHTAREDAEIEAKILVWLYQRYKH